jgi:hypothetical protein
MTGNEDGRSNGQGPFAARPSGHGAMFAKYILVLLNRRQSGNSQQPLVQVDFWRRTTLLPDLSGSPPAIDKQSVTRDQ